MTSWLVFSATFIESVAWKFHRGSPRMHKVSQCLSSSYRLACTLYWLSSIRSHLDFSGLSLLSHTGSCDSHIKSEPKLRVHNSSRDIKNKYPRGKPRGICGHAKRPGVSFPYDLIWNPSFNTGFALKACLPDRQACLPDRQAPRNDDASGGEFGTK